MDRNWAGPHEDPEIVQIGAAILQTASTENYHVGQTFSQLVRPKLRPQLSAYFTQLTGISQSNIDKYGIGFKDALRQFRKFLPSETSLICHNGIDDKWLEWNCCLHEIDMPFPQDLFFNVEQFLGMRLLKRHAHVESAELANCLQMKPGVEHDACADAVAVAHALGLLGFSSSKR